MNQNLNNKIAVWLTAVILFSGVAYLGYRFIQDVGVRAEQINDNKVANPSVYVSNENLSQTSDVGVAWTENDLSAKASANSNGEDVLIQAGDFSYVKSRPVIHLKIRNQAAFTTNQVFIQLNLWLNDAQKAVGEAVIIPVALKEPLLSGQEQVVELLVNHEKWFDDVARQAQKRRVVAQVVGVSDANMQGMDYPQTSKAVLLAQKSNHWLSPEEELKNKTASATEMPNHQASSTQIDVISDGHQYRNADDAAAYLNTPLPKNEPKILSVDVENNRDENQ